MIFPALDDSGRTHWIRVEADVPPAPWPTEVRRWLAERRIELWAWLSYIARVVCRAWRLP